MCNVSGNTVEITMRPIVAFFFLKNFLYVPTIFQLIGKFGDSEGAKNSLNFSVRSFLLCNLDNTTMIFQKHEKCGTLPSSKP